MNPKNVCVVGGAGYVGLVTGLGLAEIGHRVENVDLDRGRVRQLQAGSSPIYEEGLEPLLRRNLEAGRLRFSTDLHAAVDSSEVVFIAVGTPSHEDGQADISDVLDVVEQAAKHWTSYKVLAIRSTVPAGTIELVRSALAGTKEEGRQFDIAVNPEFLREGLGLHDFFCPARIVIGSSSERARNILRGLYEPIISGRLDWRDRGRVVRESGPVPVISTDLTSAQMIKYVSNAFLATRISFINEIAAICEEVGADIKEVTGGVGFDPRIGHGYLEAGLGFGGPCLEKDLRALINSSELYGNSPQLLKAVLERNDKQVGQVIAKLNRIIGNPLSEATVAVFGLAFKAGTNDVRNSSALRVIDRLQEEGATVRAYDPAAVCAAREVNPQVTYCDDPYETARGSDALMILTDWPDFRDLDYRRVKEEMASPRIVDGRNLLDPRTATALGFAYVGVGRA